MDEAERDYAVSELQALIYADIMASEAKTVAEVGKVLEETLLSLYCEPEVVEVTTDISGRQVTIRYDGPPRGPGDLGHR